MAQQVILPIQGVPDELIRVLNDRLRNVDTTQGATTTTTAALPNVGTPGRYPVVTTDAQGRVIQGGKLQLGDLPGGGYPAVTSVTEVKDLTDDGGSYVNRSSSIGSANLQVGGSMAPAGQYRITAYLACRTAGTGNVVLTIGFNDGIGAKTIAPTMLLTAGTFNPTNFLIRTAGSAHITYATTYSASGTYDLYIVMERLS